MQAYFPRLRMGGQSFCGELCGAGVVPCKIERVNLAPRRGVVFGVDRERAIVFPRRFAIVLAHHPDLRVVQMSCRPESLQSRVLRRRGRSPKESLQLLLAAIIEPVLNLARSHRDVDQILRVESLERHFLFERAGLHFPVASGEIAEALNLLLRFLAGVRRFDGCDAASQDVSNSVLQLVAIAEELRRVAALRKKIARLSGIVAQIVELGLRRPNEFRIARAHGFQSRSRIEQLGLHRFRVAHRIGHVFGPEQCRLEAPADPDRAIAVTGEIQNRGSDVDRANEMGDHLSGGNDIVRAHQQRHAHRFVVDENAVAVFAMLIEPFAMIRGNQREQIGRDSFRFEKAIETVNLAIGELNLGNVRIVARLSPWWRRIEGKVRIVEMQPEEKRLAAMLFHPPAGQIDGLIRAPVGLGKRGHQFRRIARGIVDDISGREIVLIEVETLRDSELRIQDECANDGRGGKAQLAKDFGQCGRALAELEIGVVAHAVSQCGNAGENCGMARQRHRNIGDRSLEEDALPSEPIEFRSARVRSPISAKIVGARRVERDEQYTRPAVLLSAGKESAERQREERNTRTNENAPAARSPRAQREPMRSSGQ